MEEKQVIAFDKNEVFELVQIVFDRDEKAALKFLEERIYKPLEAIKRSKCKDPMNG